MSTFPEHTNAVIARRRRSDRERQAAKRTRDRKDARPSPRAVNDAFAATIVTMVDERAISRRVADLIVKNVMAHLAGMGKERGACELAVRARLEPGPARTRKGHAIRRGRDTVTA